MAASDDDIDLEAELAKLSAEQLKKFEFVINEDGSVTFVDFPAELMDLAYALNPDDPLVCERRALVAEVSATSEGKLAGDGDDV